MSQARGFDAAEADRLAAARAQFGDSVVVSAPFTGRPPLWIEPDHARWPLDRDFALRWMADHREVIETALLEFGAILWRGFPVSNSDHFAAMMDGFTPFSKGYTAGTSERKAIKGQVMEATRTPGNVHILLHQEMSYLPEHPRLIAFYCRQPAAVDGETTIADMRGVLESLPMALRDRFAAHGVIYRRNMRNGDVADWRADPVYRHFSWQYWFETNDRSEVSALLEERGVGFEWLDDGSLTFWTYRPATLAHPQTGQVLLFNQIYAQSQHRVSVGDARADQIDAAYGDHTPRPYAVAFGDGGPLDEEVFAMLHAEMKHRSVKFDWRPGDLMLVENRLTAHGRRPFHGPRDVQVMLFE